MSSVPRRTRPSRWRVAATDRCSARAGRGPRRPTRCAKWSRSPGSVRSCAARSISTSTAWSTSASSTGPALFVANHSSHLDTAVLLTTLPKERRRRTAVAAAADYFFDVWWRASGSSIAFNTFPIERKGGSLSSTPADLIADGWSIVVYPEGTRRWTA